MFEYELEHICSYSATLAAPEIIGPAPEGIRANFYVTGGEATGPKIRGKLRAAGGDWITIRRDGVGVLDVRGTIETRDGALILVTYSGMLDLGEDGYDKFLRGEMPPKPRIRTTPRFFTSHPEYLWLNRLHCLGVGEADIANSIVRYDVYAVQ
jgi:hypothetical protein